MTNWRRVDKIITYHSKGVTPKYVDKSSIIVLNQKCIRNNKIDYSFAQYIDDNKVYNEDKILKVGDILINSTGQGTAGRVAMVDYIPEGFQVIVDSHILILRTNNFYESKCLNYSLFSIEARLQTFMDGSTGQGEFDKIRLFNVHVGYPEDNIAQQKIAKILSDLDSKIELNNKINAELEVMGKTLYNYWFVQFDFPDKDGKPYKSSGGKIVWNEELKREIPERWEIKKLKKIAHTGSGGTPLKSKKEYFENGTIPWINSGEVNAPFIISSKKYISQKGIENSSAKLFEKGTILMAMYGATAGQVSLIDIDASTNQAVCGIMPNDKRLIPYLKFGLEQLYSYLINISSGSARDNLSQDKIKELYFVIPEDHIIEQFYKISNSHFEKILINLKENQELASLRDWLLPMLMNGQITVADVEEQLGMVVKSDVE